MSQPPSNRYEEGDFLLYTFLHGAIAVSDSSPWMASTQSKAPAFSPLSRNAPKCRWYEEADKVFRFFGHVVDQVEPTTRQVPIKAGGRQGRLNLLLHSFWTYTEQLFMSKSTQPKERVFVIGDRP